MKTNAALNDQALKALCQEYLYEISVGIDDYLPRVKVRYVIDDNKFGYACFGNFFFFGDDFYVWESDECWQDDHNQDVVEAVFHDKCDDRGYAHRAIFAGIETDFLDTNGDHIFTGDVIKLEDSKEYIQYLAVGAWTYPDNTGYYCFILDNHCLSLADCVRMNLNMTRVGTVFYQLNTSDDVSVNDRTMQFNGWRDTEEDRLRKVLMAKFTPNFDQEEWKYSALEVIGAEYNWKD